MMAATGVSRTVVREAVAALRADGLVVVRQGVGAFVADRIHRPFRIGVDGLRSLREVLDVMELRTGIEIEAAGLAAERASASDARRIIEAYEDIDRAIERGESAVDQDFAFHCTIAQCTGNAQFLHFLEYLGRYIIPRQSIRVLSPGTVSQRNYLIRIQKEHLRILEAIRAATPASARESMRKHLSNSRKRYQKLASEIGEK
jgi:GntR family transcriptional repressor for pyruvate dehydrogenase complex